MHARLADSLRFVSDNGEDEQTFRVAVENLADTVSPLPAFCIRTRSRSGSDDILTEPSLPVFVNVCTSTVIPAPPPLASDAALKDLLSYRGDERDGGAREPSSYKIPVSVSEAKREHDALIYDVCMHPDILPLCDAFEDYKLLVTEVAMEWVEERASMHLDRGKSIDIAQSDRHRADRDDEIEVYGCRRKRGHAVADEGSLRALWQLDASFTDALWVGSRRRSSLMTLSLSPDFEWTTDVTHRGVLSKIIPALLPGPRPNIVEISQPSRRALVSPPHRIFREAERIVVQLQFPESVDRLADTSILEVDEHEVHFTSSTLGYHLKVDIPDRRICPAQVDAVYHRPSRRLLIYLPTPIALS
jgi:hypothetical protein